MNEILCSTGALLEYGGDYHLLEPLSRRLDCDGYEFMMDAPYYEEVDALIRYLQKSGFCIPVVHCEKSIGEDISKGGNAKLRDAHEKFEINCDLARRIGAGKMVVHLWDGATSDSNFGRNLAAYDRLSDTARRYGIDLLVENVVCTVADPMKRLCELRGRYPDIHFVFDTKMAAFHGQLDLLYEAEYRWMWQEGHICHYHINDYAGGYRDWEHLRSLPIGKGSIDFFHFFSFTGQSGYGGIFTVEATACHDGGVVDVEMLNRQFQYIRSCISKGGSTLR